MANEKKLAEQWTSPQGIALDGRVNTHSTLGVMATKEFKEGELILRERSPIWSNIGQCGEYLLSQPWHRLMWPRFEYHPQLKVNIECLFV